MWWEEGVLMRHGGAELEGDGRSGRVEGEGRLAAGTGDEDWNAAGVGERTVKQL